MMNRHEKWVHERNLDEIVDRLSELIASILLLSVKQINEQYLPLKKRLKVDQTDDMTFEKNQARLSQSGSVNQVRK
jgi:hypothetical protein